MLLDLMSHYCDKEDMDGDGVKRNESKFCKCYEGNLHNILVQI
jgi:hypothetical protein